MESVGYYEIQARVEAEWRQVPEPYRTAVVLPGIEDLSYEEISEITQVSLGTVKSRITRGREALKKRLTEYVKEVGLQIGLSTGDLASTDDRRVRSGVRIEVMP